MLQPTATFQHFAELWLSS